MSCTVESLFFVGMPFCGYGKKDIFKSIQIPGMWNFIVIRLRGGVAQWVARLTRNVEVVRSSPRCFLEQANFTLIA